MSISLDSMRHAPHANYLTMWQTIKSNSICLVFNWYVALRIFCDASQMALFRHGKDWKTNLSSSITQTFDLCKEKLQFPTLIKKSLNHYLTHEKCSICCSVNVWIIIWLLWNRYHILLIDWEHKWECSTIP